MALTDLVGHIEYTNPALRALWGLAEMPPLEGKLISDFWGTNWMSVAWNCLRTGEPWHGTPTPCGVDGRPLHASVEFGAQPAEIRVAFKRCVAPK